MKEERTKYVYIHICKALSYDDEEAAVVVVVNNDDDYEYYNDDCYYFYTLVLHSQRVKISKSKNVCPEWLR